MTSKLLMAVLTANLVHGAALADTGTGSFGAFSPKAFVESSQHWNVYRLSGKHSKSGFPCTGQGTRCSRTKDYTIERDLRSQLRTTSINMGIGTPEGQVHRESLGTKRTVEIKGLNNLVYSRLDEVRGSSRLGFDGSQVSTAMKTLGLYGGEVMLGHIEGKGAAWATLQPSSFYYSSGNSSEYTPQFGLTVVEKLMPIGLIQNYFANTPMRERMRDGTYWCQSDAWRLTHSLVEGAFKGDEFDMSGCQGSLVLGSTTKNSLVERSAGFFLNRQDSHVSLATTAGQQDFDIKVTTNWFCPFDCDGSTYELLVNGRPKIQIDSDRWNWLSSTGFKIKVVRIDWQNDGFQDFDKDLNALANNPRAYHDIVAVIVSEVADSHGEGYSNGSWTQHTYIMFPPLNNREEIYPEVAKSSHDLKIAFDMKLLDSVLAAMPDQVQASPELSDAEEKLDEMRLFHKLLIDPSKGLAPIDADLVFDIYSPMDATTAATWQRPQSSQVSPGKVEWLLKVLKQ